jgi:cyclin T
LGSIFRALFHREEKLRMARIATSMHLPKEPQYHTRKWYFSRQEIEDFSPSRRDGIDVEKESQLRKLYCSFIKELGVKLKV